MRFSVVTVSMRMGGLQPVMKTLDRQTFTDFEWICLYSKPVKTDLCAQLKRACELARGEYILFVQDWIELHPDSLAKINTLLSETGDNKAWTFPTLKVDSFQFSEKRGDWRSLKERRQTEFHQWEIDFAVVKTKDLLAVGGFELEGDASGMIGGEEKILASKLHWRLGTEFWVEPTIDAYVFDHEKYEPNPFHGPAQEENMVRMRARMQEEMTKALDKIK